MNEARLFGRVWRVLVGYDDESGARRTVLDVSQLDIEFDVATDITRAPNKATIKIWNLGAEKRSNLVAALADKRRRAVVSLEAGYEDQGASQIFRGEITAIRSGRGNVSTSIDIEARDSSEILRSARISQSFAPGTSVEAVVRAAASALGAGEGNLSAYASGLTVDGERSFRSGYAASGLAASVLDDLLRAAGLRWSIQKGALQLRRAGGAAIEQAVLLSPQSGLIGSPSPEDKGQVRVQCLLQPSLTPGQRVVLKSADYDGGYVIREARFVGATSGGSWHAELLLRPL